MRDSAGTAIAGAQVLVQGTGCRANAGDSGDFLISNVPAGTYTIRAQYIGYRPEERHYVLVRQADSTRVDLVLSAAWGGVALGSLPLLPRCRGLPRADSTYDAQQVQAVALCTVVAISVGGGRGPSAYCASVDGRMVRPGHDPTPDVLSALTSIGIDAVPLSACEWTDKNPPLRVRGSGAPAWEVYTEAVQLVTPTKVRVAIAYHVAMLWAAGWDCTFTRDEAGWYPRECQGTWVS